MKVTVIGDIMCEPSVMKAAKQKDGSYSFDFVFENAKKLWEGSDAVIGNLEFPLAEGLQLTSAFDVFNAPIPYGKAAKDAGLDLVSVVNNHTLDRGWEGVKKTLHYLEEISLPYTGTFLSEEDRHEAYYLDVDGMKIAVIAYTYTTNRKLDSEDKEHEALINYLRSPFSPTYLPEVRAKFQTWVDKAFPKLDKKYRTRIKNLLGLPKPFARADDFIDEKEAAPYLARLTEDIKKAKEKADFVLFYPHTGGQFNVEPGKFTQLVFDTARAAGADAILASHSHNVQKAEWIGKIPCAWSLGNFNMDSTSKIVVRDNYPEIGILMHLYFEEKALEKVTFSVTKAVWENGKYRTYPITELYERASDEQQKKKLKEELCYVLSLVRGKKIQNEEFLEEYPL